MCGICGIVLNTSTENFVDEHLLRKMTDVLVHRGPDQEGVHVFLNHKVGLGFRRLSIIDLFTGNQPLSNEDNSLWIVFNGEIYNFQELRLDLEKHGHIFRTQTDTEVILHAYEEYGEACVEHLRGMFAFAIWDEPQQRLIVGRDRLGKKPFYYYFGPEGFAFASEIKALLQIPWISRELDEEALVYYLNYKYIPAPFTILQYVKKIPPANILIFNANGNTIRTQVYWQVEYLPKLNFRLEEVQEYFLDLLRDAIRARLVGDVPIGALLSGGIDSSLIVALMAEMSDRVRTFTIGFDEAGFDERKFARIVASRYGTDHHELVVTPDMMDVLPQLVWYLDEPMADVSALPTFYVAKMARQHVTVVLNGDGGDENFGGYWHYGAALRAQRFQRLPEWVRIGGLLPFVSLINDRLSNPFLTHLDQYLEQSSLPLWRQHELRLTLFNTRQLQSMLLDQNDYTKTRYFDQFVLESKDLDGLDAMLRTDLLSFLPGQLLVKMDRMSMGNSLEARSPLLDHNVIEFAARLPTNYKIRGAKSKFLLRNLAKHYIPVQLSRRKKMGFGVPLERWLYSDFSSKIQDLLLDPHAKIYEYVRLDGVQKLLHCPISERYANSGRIWALLILEMWLKEVLK